MTKIQKILLLCTGFIFFACDKDADLPLPTHNITPVTFDSRHAHYSALRQIPAIVLVNGHGYKGNGIILVRVSQDECSAFAATCTKNINEETSKLTVSIIDFTATCPVCKTAYNVLGRTAFDKEGKLYLHPYTVTGLSVVNSIENDIYGTIRN